MLMRHRDLPGVGRCHGRHLEDARQDEQGQQRYDPEQDIDLVWGIRHRGPPREGKAWCNLPETPGLSLLLLPGRKETDA
jgi:hypothetical protein